MEKEAQEKKTTKKELSVQARIQKIRVDLQKMNIKKSGVNNFSNFEYYELADFMPILNEMLLENNLIGKFNIVPETHYENYVSEPYAKLVICDVNNSEYFEEFTSPIAEANVKGCTPIQSLGAIHTYMKRYLYMNAFEIVENDSLDPVVGKSEALATENQIKFVRDLVDDIPALLEYYKISQLEELTMKQASEIINKKKNK